ncbi:MAG: hypothetical protein A2174_02980 [Candidatus Portnoybacteria bacterium RBG_13_41_18]|uniref:Fibronectin type-III domain-containing protein n=1 Tax=Candidatus Portnoybacteria bacterium RBG_13_41_18 TaxID=1801991 RepID=A0A1G2F7M8_9BACT|nr:MAG: hypothetical protein A2174_02980 [Candidatus Portnoybacteria bacterium RBG_13_41_18]
MEPFQTEVKTKIKTTTILKIAIGISVFSACSVLAAAFIQTGSSPVTEPLELKPAAINSMLASQIKVYSTDLYPVFSSNNDLDQVFPKGEMFGTLIFMNEAWGDLNISGEMNFEISNGSAVLSSFTLPCEKTGMVILCKGKILNTINFPIGLNNYTVKVWGKDTAGAVISYSNNITLSFKNVDSSACKEIIPGHNNIDSQRANIVFVGGGYNNLAWATPEQALSFLANSFIDIEGKHKGIFSIEPFKSNKDKFNFWYVNKFIPLSSCPVGSFCNNDTIKPFFDLCPYPNKYVIQVINGPQVVDLSGAGERLVQMNAILSPNLEPGYDQNVLWTADLVWVFLHEFAHTFGLLGDEYVSFPDETCQYVTDLSIFAEHQNLYAGPQHTISECFLNAPWKSFFGNGCGQDGIMDCLPTDPEYNLEISCYEGGGKLGKGIFRSTRDSIMRGMNVTPYALGLWNEKLTIKQMDKLENASSPAPAPSISLFSPIGGEQLQKNSQQNIRWTATNLKEGTTLKILLVSELLKVTTLANNILPQAGSYTWRPQKTGSYVIRILCQGPGSSISCYDESNFFTIADRVTDTEAPTSPSDLTATGVSSSQINLTWSPSFDLGVSGLNGYFIYRNNVKITSVPVAGTQYQDIGLAPSTTYTYSVSAIDNTGNESAKSVIVTATTKDNNITLITPNGSESFKAGSSQTIQWGYTGNPGLKIKIQLLRNGSTYQTISSGTSIASSTYLWTIPSTLPTDNQYAIRIISTTNSTYYDTSDNVFTVFQPEPLIIITSPNGGESFKTGSVKYINWTYEGTPGNVKVELYNNDVFVKALKSSVSAGTGGKGSFKWLIPSVQTPGSNYKIKVSSITKPTCFDSSNSAFSIIPPIPPSINLLSPNGGENWKIGTNQQIKWTYSGNPGSSIKIYLFKNSMLNKVISYQTGINTNSFSWIVPTLTAGSDYSVKIISTSNSLYADTSGSNFMISK